jgi:hypothetical protein
MLWRILCVAKPFLALERLKEASRRRNPQFRSRCQAVSRAGAIERTFSRADQRAKTGCTDASRAKAIERKGKDGYWQMVKCDPVVAQTILVHKRLKGRA